MQFHIWLDTQWKRDETCIADQTLPSSHNSSNSKSEKQNNNNNIKSSLPRFYNINILNMFALSTRRAATMAIRRAAVANAVNPMATFSTRAYAQAEAMEETLANMQWADVKDNVKEIVQLMDEVKTNHAVHLPDAQFEGHVTDIMSQIQNMLGTSQSKKEEIADRIFDLKMEVKGKLYQA